MKFAAMCLGIGMLAGSLFAQCQTASADPPTRSTPTVTNTNTQIELTANADELNFLANGPRLYPMDKALELSKATGKPVVCWMGKHLFSDPRARELSTELKDTTIQAAMDKDDTPYDAVGPRVKFTDGNYASTAKTYYIPLAKFDKAGQADKILRVTRGGER